MALIDKRLLVEECLTIILKIHKIRAPKEIKEENTDLQQRFSIYAQFMEKDLDELVKPVSYTHLTLPTILLV